MPLIIRLVANPFFSQLSFTKSLPSVTLVDGSQIKIHDIGQTRPLPNLSSCFFNLIFISKLTYLFFLTVVEFEFFQILGIMFLTLLIQTKKET